MFECPPQGALRAPYKVRLAPHRLKRALRARKSGGNDHVAESRRSICATLRTSMSR